MCPCFRDVIRDIVANDWDQRLDLWVAANEIYMSKLNVLRPRRRLWAMGHAIDVVVCTCLALPETKISRNLLGGRQFASFAQLGPGCSALLFRKEERC
jgi:hypothetical protein